MLISLLVVPNLRVSPLLLVALCLTENRNKFNNNLTLNKIHFQQDFASSHRLNATYSCTANKQRFRGMASWDFSVSRLQVKAQNPQTQACKDSELLATTFERRIETKYLFENIFVLRVIQSCSSYRLFSLDLGSVKRHTLGEFCWFMPTTFTKFIAASKWQELLQHSEASVLRSRLPEFESSWRGEKSKSRWSLSYLNKTHFSNQKQWWQWWHVTLLFLLKGQNVCTSCSKQ